MTKAHLQSLKPAYSLKCTTNNPCITPTSADPCTTNQCTNGALCEPHTGGYACSCGSATGQPWCSNGGTCVTGINEAASCTCHAGYSGDTCDEGNLMIVCHTLQVHCQNGHSEKIITLYKCVHTFLF